MRITKDGKIYSLINGDSFQGPDTKEKIVLGAELFVLMQKDTMKYIPSMRESYGEILAKKIGGKLLPEIKKEIFDSNLIY